MSVFNARKNTAIIPAPAVQGVSTQPQETSKKEGKPMSNGIKKLSDISFDTSIDLANRRITADSIVTNAVNIGGRKFAYINTELLSIRPYQREVLSHACKIAKEWDAKKAGTLHVAYNETNGTFDIIDGQHRAAAAKMCGVDKLVCEIETDMSLSKESQLFVELNEGSKKLSPFDTFKANLFVAPEDDTDLSRLDKRIATVCKKYGVRVIKSQACGVLKTVPHTRRIMASEGEQCLDFIFSIIRDCHWDRDKNGYSYVVMESLRKIYHTYRDDLDTVSVKLRNYLINKTPRDIENEGNRRFPNIGRTMRWDAVLQEAVR